MAYIKRWESPRHNDKGRGGSARQRQLRKRHQQLRQRLQAPGTQSKNPEGDAIASPSFLGLYRRPWPNKMAFASSVMVFWVLMVSATA